MRLIYGLFLEGLTTYAIAKELTRRGILTVTGQSKWNQATINSFLRNEVRQDDTNEPFWGAMVDCVTVGVDGGMTVVFRDGTERRL